MQPLKRISCFFCICAFVYALLVSPWPGVQSTYQACFQAGGNFLFGTLGEGGAVKFAPHPKARGTSDTRVALHKRRPPQVKAELGMSSIRIGGWPTAFVIALTVATPIPWRRRRLALALGLIGVQMFIAFRVGLFLVDTFSNGDMLAIYSFPAWFKFVVHSAALILFQSPAMHYIGPLFIWLAVTFKRGDFEMIMGRVPVVAPVKERSRRSQRKS